MERVFQTLLQQHKIASLDVINLAQQPALAQQHNVRSVPHYLIGGVAFNGLKTQREVEALLHASDDANWTQRLAEEYRAGNLQDAEDLLRDHAAARQAMLVLLAAEDTELVVRIGLTAAVESLADSGLFTDLIDEFLALSRLDDVRIVTDALYYLQLLACEPCIARLHAVASGENAQLASEARDLLDELAESFH